MAPAHSVRYVEAKDGEELWQARIRAIREGCTKEYSLEQIAAWTGRPLNAELFHKHVQRCFMLVVEIDGRVEGYCMATYPEPTAEQPLQCELNGLFATSAAKGYGQKLTLIMLEEARRRGMQTMTLDSSLTAKGFYERFGFRQSGPEGSRPVENSSISISTVPMELVIEYDAQPLIRYARLTDALDIWETRVHCIQQLCTQEYTNEQIQAWSGRPLNMDMFQQLLADNYWLVVEVSGKVRGFGEAAFPKESDGSRATACILKGLFVSPSVKGHGSKLAALLVDEARRRGMKTMTVESTLTAKAFYQKMGFRQSGPQQEHVIGDIAIPCVPLVMDL